MSLFPTDEEKAGSIGYYKGNYQGRLDVINDLEKWLENDDGMIPVESIRQKLKSMKGE